jgi:hypothetical protein
MGAARTNAACVMAAKIRIDLLREGIFDLIWGLEEAGTEAR